MDSENTQQRPLQSKQERVRAQKLRMSCDACSSSKTKCDQSRPICVRCQKSGLKCNYSVSQRKGKPPAASRDLSDSVKRRKTGQDKQPTRPTDEKMGSPELDFHHAILEPTSHLDQDLSMIDMSLHTYEDAVPALWQNFIPDISDYTPSDFPMTPSNAFQHDYFSTNTSDMVQSAQTRSNDDIFNFEDEFPDVLDVGPQHTPSQPEITMSTDSLLTPASSGSNSPSRRYDCTRLASSTLDSLNLDPQACSASSSASNCSMEPSIVSFDQILMINKSAVEIAHQLLSCPCSLSQQSNLILSLIIDKIITHYQTIIHQVTHYSDASTEKLVRDTPITIGTYRLDAKDEQRMRMQLVSNEVRKAAALVERYADKYCGLGCQEREDNGIYTALTNRLRRRLKEAVGDVVSALRSSRG